jgi:hypothetical protein
MAFRGRMGNILLKVQYQFEKHFWSSWSFSKNSYGSSNLNFLEPRVPPSPSLGGNVEGAMFELLVLE